MLKKYRYLVNSWLVVVLAGPVLLALVFAISFKWQQHFGLYLLFVGSVILFVSILSLPTYFLLGFCYKNLVGSNLSDRFIRTLLIIIGLLACLSTMLLYSLQTNILLSENGFSQLNMIYFVYAVLMISTLCFFKIRQNEVATIDNL